MGTVVDATRQGRREGLVEMAAVLTGRLNEAKPGVVPQIAGQLRQVYGELYAHDWLPASQYRIALEDLRDVLAETVDELDDPDQAAIVVQTVGQLRLVLGVLHILPATDKVSAVDRWRERIDELTA